MAITVEELTPKAPVDEKKPIPIENPAPNVVSAAEDSAHFPLKTGPSRPSGEHVLALDTNIFNAAISTNPPLPMFARKNDHPVPRTGITNMDNMPVGTNKFYASLMLANGDQGVWTQPYMVWVNKDPAAWGLSISHTDLNQMAYGPDPTANPVQYYISPLGLRSLSLGAAEFNSTTSSMTTEALTPHSALLHLWADKNNSPSNFLSVPLVQGMGFVSGVYNNLTPQFDSVILIRSFSFAGVINGNGPQRQKWSVQLEDGKEWRIYAVSNVGTPALNLALSGNSRIVSTSGAFSGTIQVISFSFFFIRRGRKISVLT